MTSPKKRARKPLGESYTVRVAQGMYGSARLLAISSATSPEDAAKQAVERCGLGWFAYQAINKNTSTITEWRLP